MKENKTLNLIKFAIIIIVLIILCSCKAKRIEKTIYKTDTITRTELIKIDKPQLNTIKIENVCDSLGNLLPIYYTNTSNNVKTTLKSEDNTLKLEVDVDSIVNSRIEQYKSSITKEKEVFIKYKNKDIMWYSISLNLLLLAWIFRKPLLKLIKPF